METMYQTHIVPTDSLHKWQKTVNLISEIFEVPAALIMRVHPREIEVLVRSETENNPYYVGEKADLGTGLYCETVMAGRCQLEVPNALEDENWRENPDIALDMISYFGIPLLWTDGEIFGTLCVLDNKTRQYPQHYHKLLWELKRIIEADFAEWKRADDSVRKSEDKFLHFFKNVPVYCYMVSPQGIILDVNKAALEALGYNKHEVVNQPFKKIHAHEFLSRENKHQIEWGETGIIKGLEMTIITKDGQRRDVLLGVEAIRDENEEIVCSMAVQSDITEFRKLESQLSQNNKMEAVGRLAGGIAHDFNNMLAVILGNTELALDGLDPADPKMLNLLEIEKAARHSVEITAQLLAFSRKQAIKPEIVDLNSKIAEMETMLVRLLTEDILTKVFPGQDLWLIKIDSSQVNQVVANLVVNARDAMKRGGELTIETANVTFEEEYCRQNSDFMPGHFVMLSVSDNGTGMDGETKAHIFEPFFTTKNGEDGTGLGLATVYGIIKQNNGFINVFSEEGQGTTFKLYFPRCTEKARTIEVPVAQEVSVKLGTILLCEDNEMLRDLARKVLVAIGYTVLEARDPQDALEICQKNKGIVDLLLTDVVMPIMSGQELCDKVVAIDPGIKTLFMSGYTANVISEHGVLEERINFIQKPFTRQELADKLREVLES